MKALLLWGLCILSVPAFTQISFRSGAERYTQGFRSGVAVMVADANGDGRDDIIRLHDGNRLTVTLQGQKERFISTYFYQMSGGEQWNITGGDIDNNGTLDIITSGVYDRVKIFKSIQFSNQYDPVVIDDQSFFAQASNVVDINNDGYLDLFVCNDDEKSVIFMNDSTGNLVRNDTIIDFTTAIPSDNSGNYGSIWSDIDSDGDLDLYIAKCRQGVTNPADPRRINALYLNNGDGTYSEKADSFKIDFGAQSWTGDFGDIDNDGDFDLFVTNHDVAGFLLENIDNAYFEDITTSSGVNVTGIAMQGTFRDFDNDGLQDLIVSGSSDFLYRNIGGNQFTAVDSLFSDRPVASYGIGDLNSDGFLDVYASYTELFNDPHPILNDVIWFNTGNENHFITLNLRGVTCNASAVGARVYIYGQWGMQTREVHAGEGYGITNSLSLHFGLGAATTIDSIEVIWPHGIREVFYQVEANQHLYLEEGKCLTALLGSEVEPMTQCVLEPFTLTAPDGYIAYLWSNGLSEKEIITAEAGVYHVSVTDDQGCTWVVGPYSISTAGDIEPDEITVTLDGNLNSCFGDDILLSGPLGATSYLWSTGDTTVSIVPTTSGVYALQATYICSTLSSDTVTLSIIDPNDIVIANDTLLGGGAGELVADGDSILWYADPDGLNLLAAGTTLVTPEVDTTTTFYAQQTMTIPGDRLTAGQPDHTGLTLYNAAQTNGALRFDVFNRFKLDSVLVITTFVGERTILILDENTDTIFQKTFAIDSGRTYLAIDTWIEPGNDYIMTTNRLTNQSTFGVNSPRLYRSDRDFVYPFTIHDVLAITGTQSSQQFYYYFYDWHITLEDHYCTSDLIPAQVVVVDTSSAVLSPRVDPLELMPNPANTYVSISDVRLLIEAHSIAIFDARGIQINGWQADRSSGRLLIDKLPGGMYFVRVLTQDKTYVGQFVKN